jgi:predicted nucleic acid-binding protein
MEPQAIYNREAAVAAAISAEEYAQIRSNGLLRSQADMLIAATAHLSCDEVLKQRDETFISLQAD